ncbi:CHORD domain-containing protein [Ditylenchus destructor]|uniref:CHORD domain-containing protein n=1 Tax=Ditylenchus destructor TaxID=166010 RepID=A0AAD4N8U2_9BILA|nr:CHORD domain-containing protein [Ditylenchus destructor]
MFFSLYSILEFVLLVLNGFAIINRERVLNKIVKQRQHSFDGSDSSVTYRLVNLILSIQTVLRVPLIFANSLVICYNKGCGQKFDPADNNKDACLYHPGPPYFHDAYKIWQCCEKKSTDFGTWLSYKGCTRGCHSNEKPTDVVKASAVTEIRPEKQEDVIVWNGLNKPAARPDESLKKDLVKLNIETSETALNAINRHMEQQVEGTDPQSMIGASCKNNACEATYQGAEGGKNDCIHHPGVAIFHEGMKYWSCCQRKTSNFSAFLEQEGCTTGEHCWSKSEKVGKIREDWFSRCGYIHLNIYCKGTLPDKSTFESDGLILRVSLMHGFGEKETQLDYELWGEIVPEESRVLLGERKVEIILKQATPEGWPKLRYEHQKNEDNPRDG